MEGAIPNAGFPGGPTPPDPGAAAAAAAVATTQANHDAAAAELGTKWGNNPAPAPGATPPPAVPVVPGSSDTQTPPATTPDPNDPSLILIEGKLYKKDEVMKALGGDAPVSEGDMSRRINKFSEQKEKELEDLRKQLNDEYAPYKEMKEFLDTLPISIQDQIKNRKLAALQNSAGVENPFKDMLTDMDAENPVTQVLDALGRAISSHSLDAKTGSETVAAMTDTMTQMEDAMGYMILSTQMQFLQMNLAAKGHAIPAEQSQAIFAAIADSNVEYTPTIVADVWKVMNPTMGNLLDGVAAPAAPPSSPAPSPSGVQPVGAPAPANPGGMTKDQAVAALKQKYPGLQGVPDDQGLALSVGA